MASSSITLRSVLLSLLIWRACPADCNPWLYQSARLVLFGFCGYLLGVLLLVLIEDRVLYRGCTAAEAWLEPPPGLVPQDVEFTSADGTRLHGWWCVPPNWTPEQGALLSCHGNGGNLTFMSNCALKWRDELNVAVLLFDYPGFGRSDGKPSEAGCYASADAAYAWLTGVQHVAPARLLIHGQSLGGGVAVDLAVRQPHRALILSSTFTSFPDAAQAALPFTPSKWLARNQFRNLDKIAALKTPVFITHGTADRTIPFSQGELLYKALTTRNKCFVRIEGGKHTLYDGDMQHTVREFLADVDAAGTPLDFGIGSE